MFSRKCYIDIHLCDSLLHRQIFCSILPFLPDSRLVANQECRSQQLGKKDQGYFRVSECSEHDWNSNSSQGFLISCHYPLYAHPQVFHLQIKKQTWDFCVKSFSRKRQGFFSIDLLFHVCQKKKKRQMRKIYREARTLSYILRVVYSNRNRQLSTNEMAFFHSHLEQQSLIWLQMCNIHSIRICISQPCPLVEYFYSFQGIAQFFIRMIPQPLFSFTDSAQVQAPVKAITRNTPLNFDIYVQ